jgi:hypothetical protein
MSQIANIDFEKDLSTRLRNFGGLFRQHFDSILLGAYKYLSSCFKLKDFVTLEVLLQTRFSINQP